MQDMLKVINHSTKHLQDTGQQCCGLQQKENFIENYLRGQAKVYTTSAKARFVGVGVLDEGAEAEGAEAKGTGAGRIRDTSLGAYSFAFLKNSFISAGRRA
jgi:hypothetical protein